MTYGGDLLFKEQHIVGCTAPLKAKEGTVELDLEKATVYFLNDQEGLVGRIVRSHPEPDNIGRNLMMCINSNCTGSEPYYEYKSENGLTIDDNYIFMEFINDEKIHNSRNFFTSIDELSESQKKTLSTAIVDHPYLIKKQKEMFQSLQLILILKKPYQGMEDWYRSYMDAEKLRQRTKQLVRHPRPDAQQQPKENHNSLQHKRHRLR